MSEAAFHELFPLVEDDTPYRKLTGDHVALAAFEGERVVRVMPEALTLLALQAFVDCQHLLRPGDLARPERNPTPARKAAAAPRSHTERSRPHRR